MDRSGGCQRYVGTDGRVVSPRTPVEAAQMEGTLGDETASSENLSEPWIPKLYRGLTLDQARYECRLRGVGESGYLRGCLKRLVTDDLAKKLNPNLHPVNT